MSRRLAIKLLAALTVFGAVFAMAATLTVSSDDLGAGNTTVAACDTDGVNAAYASAWDATDERYEVATVTVEGIAAACNLQNVKVTLVGTDGASLGEGSVTGLTSDGTLDTSEAVSISPAAAAASVTGVHVTIAE